MNARQNLSEVAVEVKLAELDASLLAASFACELESLVAGAARNRLMYIAGKIGLSEDATRLVLDQYEHRAKLLHEAHVVLRRLIDQQAAVAV